MSHMGLYIGMSAAECVTWLQEYTQTAGQAPYRTEQGEIVLEPAQQRRLLNQYLAMEIDGVHTDGTGSVERLTGVITFRVLPIGKGASIEVAGVCREPAVEPYFVGLVESLVAQQRVPPDAYWLGELRKIEQQVAQTLLKTDWRSFERALKEFAGDYHTDEIRYVAATERHDLVQRERAVDRHNQPLDRRKKRSWRVDLALATVGRTWQGIEQIWLDFELSRISGKYPLRLTVTVEGFRYREVEPLAAAFLAHCQRLWRTSPVDQAETESRPASSVALQAETQPWEQIPDHLWDRKALELWWQDYTCPEIGNKIGQSPKTVLNRISVLRKLYGEALVPTEKQRRAKARKLRTTG
jgi:hypothetical protein